MNLYKHQYLNIENFEMVIYAAVAFFLPLFIGHPQIIVGVVVNALLIISALNVKGYKLLPVIIMPVLGALSRGVLFGPFTVFLLFMAPFIWIGNGILVAAFRKIKLNYFVTLIIGSAVKAGFLFLCAFVLYKLGAVPALFLTTMGMFQLYTALLGGVAAYGYQRLRVRI